MHTCQAQFNGRSYLHEINVFSVLRSRSALKFYFCDGGCALRIVISNFKNKREIAITVIPRFFLKLPLRSLFLNVTLRNIFAHVSQILGIITIEQGFFSAEDPCVGSGFLSEKHGLLVRLHFRRLLAPRRQASILSVP